MNFYVEIEEIDLDFDLQYSIIILCFYKALMQQFNLLPLYPPTPVSHSFCHPWNLVKRRRFSMPSQIRVLKHCKFYVENLMGIGVDYFISFTFSAQQFLSVLIAYLQRWILIKFNTGLALYPYRLSGNLWKFQLVVYSPLEKYSCDICLD